MVVSTDSVGPFAVCTTLTVAGEHAPLPVPIETDGHAFELETLTQDEGLVVVHVTPDLDFD